VVEVEGKIFEDPPDTLPPGIRKYVKGIYKMNGTLLSLLDMEKITKELAPNFE
jgi:purine-binding chemotaxis protein CheW